MPSPLLNSSHICHLTVLNPAIHTRIFYKLAWSQMELGYRVSVIGQDARDEAYETEHIKIIPTGTFSRKSLSRVFASFRIMRRAKVAGADLYVLHTPELLMAGWWIRHVWRKRVVYDVHEDYKANIELTRHYPRWLRGWLGKWIRAFEKRAVSWLDAVSYAEENYDNFLDVPASKKFILRNTFTKRPARGSSHIEIPSQPYMLFSGTISADRGIFRTLDLWGKFNEIKSLRLVVAGVSFLPAVVAQIWQQVEELGLRNRFHLIGGDTYLPYPDILHLIKHCAFGTALYSGSLMGRMPTKFYEFMAHKKPLIYTRDAYWDAQNTRAFMGFPYADGDDVAQLLSLIENQESYPPFPGEDSWHWRGEEPELRRMLDLVLANT